MSFQYSPKVVTEGLVLYLDAANTKSYPGSGTVWNDLSRSGNNGTLINGPTFNSGNGGSIVFDGVNDSATVGTISFNSNIITTTFWFKWLNYANDDDLLVELSTNGNLLQNTFIIDPNSSAPTNGVFQFSIFGNGIGNYYGSYINRPTQNVWHNLSIIWDNSTTNGNIICYLNGILQNTTVNRNLKNSSGNFRTDNLYLMSRAGASLFGNGEISNLNIYNRALTAQEVLQNYNATKSRYGL